MASSGASVVIATCDLEGRILSWTEAPGQSSGFAPHELAGRALASVLSGCPPQVSESESPTRDAALLCKDGTRAAVRVRTQSVLDPEGRPLALCSVIELPGAARPEPPLPESDAEGHAIKLVGVNIDITEQKLANEALARSQKLEALGTLAGGIAHDFNNILQAVLGNVGLGLAETAEDNPARPYFQEIEIDGRRAAELVRQILTFSRPREIMRRPVDLSVIVNEALQLLRATLPSSLAIKTQAASNLPLVSADPTQVHQVIVNLATNAAHAVGRASGSIEIALEEVNVEGRSSEPLWELAPGRYVQLAVRDTGSGMDRETLSRVFDPFFTTRPPGEGTGLGLSVVHGIMRGLGGGVSVASELGQGSVFRLYFPIAERVRTTSSTPPPVPRGAGQRILFVDDERALSLVGKQALSRFGYQVDAFVDPAEALLAFRSKPDVYAALVTDLTMPTLNGFELAEAVLSQRPQLPVLLMSGFLGNEENARAQRLGIQTLVMKPVAFETLAMRLHLALSETSPASQHEA